MKNLAIVAALAALLAAETTALAQRRGTTSGLQPSPPRNGYGYAWLPGSLDGGRANHWLPNSPSANQGRSFTWLPSQLDRGIPGTGAPSPTVPAFRPIFLADVPMMYLPR